MSPCIVMQGSLFIHILCINFKIRQSLYQVSTKLIDNITIINQGYANVRLALELETK